MTYARALQKGNFQLYIEVLTKSVPWFFALDHTHYTSLVPNLFFATKRIDGWMREKYGLVSTAEVTVRMRETIHVLVCIKLNS